MNAETALVYQCPGCWSMTRLVLNEGGYECVCGERMTRIDLRDSEVEADLSRLRAIEVAARGLVAYGGDEWVNALVGALEGSGGEHSEAEPPQDDHIAANIEHERRMAAGERGYKAHGAVGWVCDWQPDDLNPGPDCPYCAGAMCARFDGLGCTHDRIERHGYPIEGHSEAAPPQGSKFRERAATAGVGRLRSRLAEAIRPLLAYGAEPPEYPELAGHDLVCWCPLDQPCHADVLLEMANG